MKGTSVGAVTDENGKFSIEVPDEKAFLIISFVGYDAQEIQVGNRSEINVKLMSNSTLEEVVVVGYSTQKKVNMTGAVSSVDGQALENRPVSNAANALQGLSPGLMITRQGGQPGSEGIDIQIRGATTANGSVAPLIVLDGVAVPGNTLTTMNPNDIESISVLKDAAAAGIYGAQAAGGVILVTTKKAQAGKIKMSYLLSK